MTTKFQKEDCRSLELNALLYAGVAGRWLLCSCSGVLTTRGC